MTDPGVPEEVLREIRPSEDERARLREAYESVRRRAEEALDDRGVDAEVTLVGSAARDTWLSGDRDIDVFLLLPPGLDREGFEDIGLGVGREVFPDGEVEYAEHPYVRGEEDGYDVDIVPCYDLDDPTEVRSAVDRTPFHNGYVRDRSDGVEGFGDEVRLLKAFARGSGVYGSDLRTRGFSGYLCELLVLRYGGFGEVVDAAADWSSPLRLEPEPADTSDEGFEGPMVVVDPVDPSRNVAAVVSDDSFARFVTAARDYVDSPDESYFFEGETEPIDREGFVSVLDDRGTRLVAVVFERPGIVDDQLYPQLRKTRTSLVEELGRRGFNILRSDAFVGEVCVILVEANVGEQSSVEKHVGPPVDAREHAEAFRDKYADDEGVAGPYVEGGRYVVERGRDHTTVESFVGSEDLLGVGVGEHVGESIREGYEVLVDEGCAALVDEYGFGTEFAGYFDPEVY